MPNPILIFKPVTSIAKSLGVSSAEYALILGLVVIVAIPALMMQGETVKDQLESQTAQVSQLDQMTKLLQAPPAGYSNQGPEESQAMWATNDGSQESSKSFLEALQITESANGKLNVVGAGTNTTSSEGSTVSNTLASQLEAMANNPEFQAEAKQISEMAKRARQLARLQDNLDKQRNVENYNELLNKTKAFQKEAQKLDENPTLTHLNSIVLNIAKKNYLDPAQSNLKIEKEVQVKGRGGLFGLWSRTENRIEKVSVEKMELDKDFNLQNFTKKANSTTTRETATKMETTPPALNPPSTQNAAG